MAPKSAEFDGSTMSPGLLSDLLWAHQAAGRLEAHVDAGGPGKRALLEARERRVLRMAERVEAGLTLETVSRVLANKAPPAASERARDAISRSDALCEMLDQRAQTRDESTHTDALAYLGGGGGSAAQVAEDLEACYAALDTRPLLAQAGILRAGALAWALAGGDDRAGYRAGLDALIAHELRAAGVDAGGLLVLADHRAGADALAGDARSRGPHGPTGPTVGVLSAFARAVARSLESLAQRLDAASTVSAKGGENEAPKALDGQLLALLRGRGITTSRALAEALPSPPPPRTLQRHLHRLVAEGLVIRHGGRKNAGYEVSTSAPRDAQRMAK